MALRGRQQLFISCQYQCQYFWYLCKYFWTSVSTVSTSVSTVSTSVSTTSISASTATDSDILYAYGWLSEARDSSLTTGVSPESAMLVL